MIKSKLPRMALLFAALVFGSTGIAHDALARGGHGGGAGHGGHGSIGHSHDSSVGGARAGSSRNAGPARGAVDRAQEPAMPTTARNVGGHDDWRDWQFAQWMNAPELQTT